MLFLPVDQLQGEEREIEDSGDGGLHISGI